MISGRTKSALFFAPESGSSGVAAPKTLTVPDAGRQYFGLGRTASYDAARRGELPIIKIGGSLRVSVAALDRMLEEAGQQRKAS